MTPREPPAAVPSQTSRERGNDRGHYRVSDHGQGHGRDRDRDRDRDRERKHHREKKRHKSKDRDRSRSRRKRDRSPNRLVLTQFEVDTHISRGPFRVVEVAIPDGPSADEEIMSGNWKDLIMSQIEDGKITATTR